MIKRVSSATRGSSCYSCCLAYFRTSGLYLFILLCLAGDIELNPGPTDMSSLSSDEDSSNVSDALLFDKYFSVVHYNVQSVTNKLDILQAELSHFDVIALTETWLSTSTPDHDLEFENYHKPIRKERVQDNHGGVMVYLKNNLVYKRRADLEPCGIECLWLEILLNSKSILLGVFYRPPNSNSKTLKDIENSIGLASDSGLEHIIVTGDFNCNMLSELQKRKIDPICTQNNLTNIINEPTHFTENSSTLLDLFLVSKPDSVMASGVGESFLDQNIRYHCPIYSLFNFTKHKPKSFVRQIWKYNEADYNLLRTEVERINWAEIVDSDIDIYTEKFTNAVKNVCEKVIPSKVVRIRPSDPPWFCSSIRYAIRKRKRAFRRAKRTNLPEHWATFKIYRNEAVKVLRNAKASYFNKLSNKLHSETLKSKDWWNTMKSFITTSSSSNEIPPIYHNDSVYSEPNEKANVFNEFFYQQTVLNERDKVLPQSPENPDRPLLSNIQVTPEDIQTTLSSLSLGKASGPDGINNRILKELSHQLAIPLSSLFNLSLQSGKFPSTWKQANVSPIYKKDDPNLVCNYRPISLLCTVGKVFEKIIHKYVCNFFNSYNIITPLQSGFRHGDSTVNQLLDLSHTISKALDAGLEVRAVFFDISKAFDRVWHDGLLVKLKNSGISGKLLHWFSDYLGNRRQRVVLPGGKSDWKSISAGVPQGSILGPLLFLVFINDIVQDITSFIKLFADDTSLYIIVDTPSNTAESLNADIEKIRIWAEKWLVSFNPTKSEAILFSRKRNHQVHPPLEMNSISIKEVENHKHLGLYLSNDGSWNAHINYIVNKTSLRVNILRKLKHILDRHSLQVIYFSFIRPSIEYADIIWDNCTSYNRKRIESIQIDCARIVTGTTKLISLNNIYLETGWETLDSRRKKHRLIQFYKMVNGISPEYLANLVPHSVGETQQYNLRNSDDLIQQNCRTKLFFDSFLPATIRDWNELPAHYRNADSLFLFKHLLNESHQPKPHFYFTGTRVGQIHHARLRTKCSSLKQHLWSSNIVETPYCECGLIENNDHFLLKCPRYTEMRVNMIRLIRPLATPSCDVLLFGDSSLSENVNQYIFTTVQKYIIRTKRFQ